MSIYGNPAMLGGSGGGGSSTIVPKTITANGVYNASADSADGYNPVTVNVVDTFSGGVYLSRGVIIGKEIGHFDSSSDAYFAPADSNGSIIRLNTSQPFEIGMLINFSDATKVVALCGQVNSASWGSGNRAPSIVPSNNGAYCAFAFPGSSGWATIINPLPPSGYALPNNTDIFFKMAWDGATCSALINDGTNTMTASAAVASLYYNSNNYMVFATQGRYAAAVPRWSVYKMDKLYLKQNGTLIWGKES